MRRRSGFNFALLLLLLLPLACARLDDQTVEADPNAFRIGFLYNLGTEYSKYGRGEGAQMAVAEINGAGGIRGRKLQLLMAADQAGSPDGLVGTRTLLGQDVAAIVGTTTSQLHVEQAALTVPAGVPIISCSATSASLTQLVVGGQKVSGDLSWRTPPSDAFQGVFLAERIRKEGITRMGILYRDDTYGRNLSATFQGRFVALGGQILASVPYSTSQTSGFETQVQHMLTAGIPDGILLVSLANDGAAMTWALHVAQISPKPALFGTEGVFQEAFLLSASPTMAQGMKGSAPVPPEESTPYIRFRDIYTARMGQTPDAFTATAYDSVYLVALALAAGGSEGDPKLSIRKHLRQVSGGLMDGGTPVSGGEFAKALDLIQKGQLIDYEGASGALNFDANGDVTDATYAWWIIEEGRFRVISTGHP